MTDLTIKTGDTAPALTATLFDGPTPLNLNGASVRIRMRSRSGGPLVIDAPATIDEDPTTGKVYYQWQAGDTDEPGLYEVEWLVTFMGGEKQTFPNEGYTEVEIEPGLTSETTVLPALADQCWPVDEGCCSDFDSYSTEVQARAKALATQTLRALTGFRVGGCPITVWPSRENCVHASSFPFMPNLNSSGAWVNTYTFCGCNTEDWISLPAPIGRIDEVTVDGVVLDPALYRLDGFHLVRTDGVKWPTTSGSVSVTYLNAYPVDGLGAYAAGILACEYAKACGGGKCRLPSGVTEITRQGIAMTITTGSFPNGKTGIREVDAYIMRWNPTGLRAGASVWTP